MLPVSCAVKAPSGACDRLEDATKAFWREPSQLWAKVATPHQHPVKEGSHTRNLRWVREHAHVLWRRVPWFVSKEESSHRTDETRANRISSCCSGE